MKTVPLSLHEDMISRHFARQVGTGEVIEDRTLSDLQSTMLTGRKAAQALAGAHSKIMGNQLATPLANAKQSREVAFHVYAKVAKQLDAALNRAKAELQRLKSTMEPRPPKDFAAALVQGQVRTALSTMTPQARRRAFDDALTAGDKAVLEAVLIAPSIASGISMLERDMLRQSWDRRFHEDDVERINRIEKAMHDTVRAGEAFLSWVNTATDANSIDAATGRQAEAHQSIKALTEVS